MSVQVMLIWNLKFELWNFQFLNFYFFFGEKTKCYDVIHSFQENISKIALFCFSLPHIRRYLQYKKLYFLPCYTYLDWNMMNRKMFLTFCFLFFFLRDNVHSVRAPLTPEQRQQRAAKRAESQRVSNSCNNNSS